MSFHDVVFSIIFLFSGGGINFIRVGYMAVCLETNGGWKFKERKFKEI